MKGGSPDDGGRGSSVATSRSLIVRAKQNQPEAWDRLVDLYAPLVYLWCRQLRVREQDVADVFQDVFQTLARTIGTFQKENPDDTSRGWLRTITRSRAVDHFRRTGRQPVAVGGTEANVRLAQQPDPIPGDADDSDDDRDRNELFLRALHCIQADFAERTWQAFWKVVVEGLTPREAGEELEMRPGTVRVSKSRVLHRLREQFGDLLD